MEASPPPGDGRRSSRPPDGPSWRTVGLVGVLALAAVVVGGLVLLPSDREPAPTRPTLPPPIDAEPGAGAVLDRLLPPPVEFGPEWTAVFRWDTDDPAPTATTPPAEIFTALRICGETIARTFDSRGAAVAIFAADDGSVATFQATLHPDADVASDALEVAAGEDGLDCTVRLIESAIGDEAEARDIDLDTSIDDLRALEGLDDPDAEIEARRLRVDMSNGDRSIPVFVDVVAIRYTQHVVTMVFSSVGAPVRQQFRDALVAGVYGRASTIPR